MTEEKNYYTPEELKQILQEHNISMESFSNFIWGQGCPVVDGVYCYFKSDVDRYVNAVEFESKWIRMLADMVKLAKEAGVELTENTERIAKARIRMGIPITVCPCASKDGDRGCISEKCLKQIKEEGTCCCRAFAMKGETNGKLNKGSSTL